MDQEAEEGGKMVDGEVGRLVEELGMRSWIRRLLSVRTRPRKYVETIRKSMTAQSTGFGTENRRSPGKIDK